jgi:hypothetical protein
MWCRCGGRPAAEASLARRGREGDVKLRRVISCVRGLTVAHERDEARNRAPSSRLVWLTGRLWN